MRQRLMLQGGLAFVVLSHLACFPELTQAKDVPKENIFSFANHFSIPPNQASYAVENACCYTGREPLRVLAVRVGTRDLGRLVSLDHVSGDGSLVTILERDPRNASSQHFQPLSSDENLVILPGTRLQVTCR
ncbi:hypothetical protein CYMTET_52169 [Cymbomonas tetramitiformis]|uniref:Copper type II ascorbate-dependent monooxygenase C-terminal domain-containing protein n=1 Tax=Cymbomonas tetramitiformis TaxID=36881 RepID=A0AAE0BJI4_9CHLO|nr:hypothetical protein CYMTET_52169 [Cymbomonas tetramitiformis]